ncbi:MAG: hypothetical protein SXQ77_11890 [Halobacteria archaeon]|nr:hypothetical protein [Halobacteria archaeon]
MSHSSSEGSESGRLDPERPDSKEFNRKRATKAVLPLLFIGLLDLYLLLEWGLNPLWGFVILPPILLVSTFGWIYFRAVDESET